MAGKQSPKGRAETGQPVEEMVSVILEPKGADLRPRGRVSTPGRRGQSGGNPGPGGLSSAALPPGLPRQSAPIAEIHRKVPKRIH